MSKKIYEYFVYFLCAFIILLALFGKYYAPYSANEINLANKFASNSLLHIFGTDHLGRDIFSRILEGAYISILATFSTIIIIIVLGVSVGFIAGFSNNKIDNFLMRICDIFLCFPTIVLALFFVGILGTGLLNIIIAIALTHWAWYARIIRSIVLKLKNTEYVLISKTCGASNFKIFKKHFAKPICMQLLVLSTLDLGHIMLHISGLSLLGLGVKAPQAEWGIMIAETKDYILTHYELILYPGIAMLIVIIAFNLLGDILRDKFENLIQVESHG
ncbi:MULTISPECIES: nickel ABC transporter permease subunit NikC [unclassified Campylobacter]|uniref:nickel ABC transporter permease subunit NikC n=1 Tax=unclassified Campylobacter TaxID=2593542 RepID=UPI001BD9A343|nr:MULTISPECIES: nickel ABC transporter permease subunit NikC [unclassified Campylobacter]MBZ7980678.1 nickel ABC transporter permease subunit NikC [Campylobacter sp. RM12642]MBZ7981972.1 nickel ABC transporter permease subunit NikC [Campylobacter sp. RM12640]MBZ7989910.1 nickel ABC transporter permease subunit NikC [Campylobacter sp. RM12635]MBZ7993796.1 nickel ABC transporter permease subunit NikC [Campylobacter sp. RM9333]MBZ8008392.1 nickel ABC transporter permease subunit NikC [Campylobac